jgi:ubiquinone/menaquinone biosynthesis C-methylase UbiE
LDVNERMRKDWDERARSNAFHYIASWKQDWEEDAFLRSGEEDYLKLVAATLERCGLESSGSAMLELGCGAGRMTGSFARRYERVIAVDLSAEMLSRAAGIHEARQNILWLRVGGANLACLKSEAVDFVFSYLVLQHLPSRDLVEGYLKEMVRVLRPGKVFLFQFNGSSGPTMNWRGRMAWGVVDALWSSRMGGLSRAAAKVMGLDARAAGKSWRGAAVEARDIAAMVQSSGCEIKEIAGENTPMAWCCGIKGKRAS